MDPDCDLTRISCELRRIADLMAVPDVFDYLSGIGVPIILGLATLILAVFTIRTANRANKISVELERERQSREDRTARRAIVPDIVDWASYQILLKPSGDLEAPEMVAASRKVREHRQRLGDPTIDALTGWVRDRATKYHAARAEGTETEGVAAVYGDVQSVIQGWAEEPETAVARQRADTMRAALLATLEQIKADRQETIDLATEMFRRAPGEAD
jgi:hypothetical protein